MKKTAESRIELIRAIILAIVFLSLTCLLYLGFREDTLLTSNAQKICYSLGMGALLAGLATLLLAGQISNAAPKARKRWFYPLVSGLLALGCMSLAYMYLGVWPIGDRSVMIVDMHHQYAPLLAQLRDMLLHGGNPLYSFDIGLGCSFLPLFGYYLASPFNLLLMLFPESLLTEGILVITLLKNALTAASFALCVQYIYRRRDYSVMIVSIMYSMMMYLLAYSWNIMWLDCVMILPLLIMSFEKLMRTGRYLPYVLCLAYALYANYYIAFMLCIFLVLYFVVYSARQVRTMESRWRSFGRFAIGSLLGGGLVMFLLIPVYISLQHTSAAGGALPEMANNFDIFNLLGRHLFESSPTIRSGNLPNIYCGILSVVLLPLFCTTKTIPLRRRLSYIGLWGVMAASLVLNQFDMLWHGLHAPNDLPYRFSFLYSFVLLLIAYEALLHLRDITMKQIGGCVVGIVSYLIIEERFGEDKYTFDSLYISLLLVLLYAVIITLVSRKRVLVRPAYCLLLLVVTAEMTFNAGATFKALNSKEYFTAHKDYVDNDTTKALHTAVDRTEMIGNQASNGAFYRLEFLPRRTTVDTALYDYSGLTVFASSNPQSVTKFMGYLGYAINGVNSYLYKSYVPVTDALFGLKYVILKSDMSSHPQLTKLDSASYGSETYYIYENTKALPLGFLVKSAAKEWQGSRYNPVMTQNTLYSAMTGTNVELYTNAPLSIGSQSAASGNLVGVNGFSIGSKGANTATTFTATIAKTGQVYAYVDCSAAKSISVSVNSNSWTSSPSEPYIIDAGTLSKGDTVEISVTTESACSGNIYVGTLNSEVFNAQIEKLSANPLTVTSYSDTNIAGSIKASESGTVFTSIPYDDGWTVKVDGVKVTTCKIGDAMLAFDVTAGTHTVEMSFLTPGLLPGIIISIISLALLVLLLVFITRKVNPNDPTSDEFTELARLLAADPVTADGAELEPLLRTPPDNAGGIEKVSQEPVEESQAGQLPESTGEVPAEQLRTPGSIKEDADVDHHTDAGL